MKHESETPSLDKLQKERLNEIRQLERDLYYDYRKLSTHEYNEKITRMNYLTRKFLYPFDCQNA